MKQHILIAAIFLLSTMCGPARSPGLQAGPDATVLRDGKPFRAIGVNYFSCFLRTLKDGNDTSYDEGFRVLAEQHIPFARFCATGFWPKDMALYQTDREEYFRRLDGVVKSAEKHGIGLVPSLFWYFACVPDLVGEPMDQWGNPQSKTHEWMRGYVREVVTRYKDSPAIWAWEMGNEFSLGASLPNAKEHRPPTHPGLGTPETRSERDDLTFDMVRVAFAEFAKTVREHDAGRLIFTGDALLRPCAWHMEHEGKWTHDTKEQFQEMLAKVNPDPVSGISVHAYGDKDCDRCLAWSGDASRKMNKPLFVGEFGAPGTTPEGEATFRHLLKTIEDSSIPLAALWVFDLPSQNKDFNITLDNHRAYQLKEVSEANARVKIGMASELPGPTIENVPYGTHERQVLDFWKAKSDKPTPLLFYIHGGGWVGGEKRRIGELLRPIPDAKGGRTTVFDQYLAAGISVVSINYRYISQAQAAGVKPPVKWPLEDAARALQLVRSKAAEWNIDKTRIAASGGSAGACSSLWLAFHPDMADPKSSDPVARESTRLLTAAVLGAQTTLDPQQMKEWTPNSNYGGHAFGFNGDKAKNLSSFQQFLANRESILPWIAEYSPYALVTSDDPPVYLYHVAPPALGQDQKDPTHTANFGVKLQEKLRSVGVECELAYPAAPETKHPTVQTYLLDRLK